MGPQARPNQSFLLHFGREVCEVEKKEEMKVEREQKEGAGEREKKESEEGRGKEAR